MTISKKGLDKDYYTIIIRAMEDKIKIVDKSGDKEFFTILPNYILNHSTSEEQILYAHMKRFAGENGKCFATQQTLAGKLGWTTKKVRITIKKLLERKWVVKQGTIKGKTHPIDAYEVVNLWHLNSDFYRKKKGVKLTHISNKNKRYRSGEPIRKGSERPIEEELYKEDLKERELTPSQEMILFLKDNKFFNKVVGEFSEKEKLSLSVAVTQLQGFRSYWSELNRSGKKQKWEMQPTFELRRRIGTWLRKAEQFGDIQSDVKVRQY